MPQKIVERSETLTHAQLLTANVLLLASQKGDGISLGKADFNGYTPIAVYTVKPQTRLLVGRRPDLFDKDVGGIFYAFLKNTSGAEIKGDYKIILSSADGLKKAQILTRPSNTMYSTSPSDRSKQTLLKIGANVPLTVAREDSLLVILLKPNTDNQTLDFDHVDNQILLDVTVQHIGENMLEWI
jgi:hypothetical protein